MCTQRCVCVCVFFLDDVLDLYLAEGSLTAAWMNCMPLSVGLCFLRHWVQMDEVLWLWSMLPFSSGDIHTSREPHAQKARNIRLQPRVPWATAGRPVCHLGFRALASWYMKAFNLVKSPATGQRNASH